MTTLLAPSVTHRDPKGRKFISIVESAYDKAGLSEEEAQRVNDTAGLPDLIASFIGEHRSPNQFAGEEVSSDYIYPSEYTGPKPVAEQVRIFKELFPELADTTFDQELASQSLPTSAEGWFAIPRWQVLAKTYGEALDKMLKAIGSSRTFHNYRDGQTGPEYLRQSVKTVEALAKLASAQEGHDILLIPCQFGLRHRGRSSRRAREVMNMSEFGLGAYQVAVMLLTHPERLTLWEQLHVDCAGDEFSPGADGGFALAPFFLFFVGLVQFHAHWCGHAVGDYGSVSGFLPQ